MNIDELQGDVLTPDTAPSQDEKTMALLSHILTIIGGFLAPLIIYLLKKDESTFISDHAKESLNFQITLFLAYVVCIILMVVLIGAFLFAIVAILQLVLVIIATIKANEGKLYKYPFNIRFIK